MTSPARPPRPTPRPKPFAIGVLGLPDDIEDLDHREERLQVALSTHALGYFLLDVFEVRRGEPAGYERAEELAVRTDADAFVVRGEVDSERLTSLADRLRMRIRYPAG